MRRPFVGWLASWPLRLVRLAWPCLASLPLPCPLPFPFLKRRALYLERLIPPSLLISSPPFPFPSFLPLSPVPSPSPGLSHLASDLSISWYSLGYISPRCPPPPLKFLSSGGVRSLYIRDPCECPRIYPTTPNLIPVSPLSPSI